MTTKAIVTGGLGAIGTAISQALGRAGHHIIAIGHPSEANRVDAWAKALADEGITAEVKLIDVADFAACEAGLAGLDNVEVLVNCAGITRDAFMHKMPQESWEQVIDVNLNGAFNVTRQLWPAMRESGKGRVINISSVNGQRGQFGQTNYSASKSGLHGFTMALAQEGARKGVTVNTVSPGYIDTVMTQAIAEEIRNQIVASIPMGRMGQPEDIANAVAFLASPEAAYITGANVPVNGGLFTSF